MSECCGKEYMQLTKCGDCQIKRSCLRADNKNFNKNIMIGDNNVRK